MSIIDEAIKKLRTVLQDSDTSRYAAEGIIEVIEFLTSNQNDMNQEVHGDFKVGDMVRLRSSSWYSRVFKWYLPITDGRHRAPEEIEYAIIVPANKAKRHYIPEKVWYKQSDLAKKPFTINKALDA